MNKLHKLKRQVRRFINKNYHKGSFWKIPNNIIDIENDKITFFFWYKEIYVDNKKPNYLIGKNLY